LREPAQSLRFSGHFRLMVLRAAERLLKMRGAAAFLPDDASGPVFGQEVETMVKSALDPINVSRKGVERD
jgi:hypothetical protein